MGLSGLWYFAAGHCCLFICVSCFLGWGWASLLFPLASVPEIAPAKQRSQNILHVNDMLISFLDHKTFCFDYYNKIYTFIATTNIFIGLQKLAWGASCWTRKSYMCSTGQGGLWRPDPVELELSSATSSSQYCRQDLNIGQTVRIQSVPFS